jgi:hypothetical protein
MAERPDTGGVSPPRQDGSMRAFKTQIGLSANYAGLATVILVDTGGDSNSVPDRYPTVLRGAELQEREIMW